MYTALLVSNAREIADLDLHNNDHRDDSRFVLPQELILPASKRFNAFQFVSCLAMITAVSTIWMSVGYYAHLKKMFGKGLNPWLTLPYISDCGAESLPTFAFGMCFSALIIVIMTATVEQSIALKLKPFSNHPLYQRAITLNKRSLSLAYITGVSLACIGIFSVRRYERPHQLTGAVLFPAQWIWMATMQKLFNIIMKLKNDPNLSLDQAQAWSFPEKQWRVRFRSVLVVFDLIFTVMYIIFIPFIFKAIFRTKTPSAIQAIGAVAEFLVVHILIGWIFTLLPYMRRFDTHHLKVKGPISY